MEHTCFAKGSGSMVCRALLVKKCERSNCAFFKTNAQVRTERKRAKAHIASLDAETQAYIREKYYSPKQREVWEL